MDINRLQDEDVIDAFTYLLTKIETFFNEVDFPKLKKKVVLATVLLPQHIRCKIKKAENSNNIIEVLAQSLYCNWLNVRLLKRIAKNNDNQRAVNVIQIYEDHVYSRKASSVKKYFALIFNEEIVSEIELTINKCHEDVTIKEVIEYCGRVEEITGIETGIASVKKTGPGSLKITIFIPLHCSLHAFKMAKEKFYKLRQFHIQCLEIGSYSKVFAMNCLVNECALSHLLSNAPNCKFVYTYICRYIHIATCMYICSYIDIL